MGKMSQTQKILGERPAGKGQMKRPSRVLGDNIKIKVAEIRREDWIWTRSELFCAR
jgi:hypothetical protein